MPCCMEYQLACLFDLFLSVGVQIGVSYTRSVLLLIFIHPVLHDDDKLFSYNYTRGSLGMCPLL